MCEYVNKGGREANVLETKDGDCFLAIHLSLETSLEPLLSDTPTQKSSAKKMSSRQSSGYSADSNNDRCCHGLGEKWCIIT
jgi:hypothetical protein